MIAPLWSRADSVPSLPFARPSRRPALTHLVMLAMSNPGIVERLLRGETVDAIIAHPHYAVELDAHDQATVETIRDRSRSVEEFLTELADVADGVIQ